jgi:hypothetical protein
MTPVTHKEYFLAKLSGEEVEIPSPVTREEVYLAILCGETIDVPTPATIDEEYLAALCGMSITPSAPVTRLQMIWAGLLGEIMPEISPVTREEMYWANTTVGYQRLNGLTFNNNAYYRITGFKMRGSDTLRFSFKCTLSSPACNVCGAYDGASASTNYSLYLAATNSQYLRYNGASYNSKAVQNKTYSVILTPTGSSGMEVDSTWTEKTFESSGDFCVGTTSPTATSSKMVGDIIGSVVVDGRLELIPVKRLSDSKLGYYDTISRTFYGPIGGTPESL